jgi:hypothetical protein
MSKKRGYVRQSESQHPSAIEFSAFVQKLHEDGKPVTRAMAIKWIISSYKREALIRFGAKKRASEAIRHQKSAGDRPRKQESMTISAVAFSRDGYSITEREAEAFLDTGISAVMQRLVQCRAGTYVYDRNDKVFVPTAASKDVYKRRNTGVVSKILNTLSGGDMTASEIAEQCLVDVGSVRNNLNRLRRAGTVEESRKQKQNGRGNSQIVWRLREAICNLST